MALLPADIPTGRVVGQFAFLVQDGPDGDTKPDSGAVLGEVTFTCSASIVRFPGKPLTAVPLSFVAEIINDTLTAKGGAPSSDGIELLATDSSLTNPTGFTWRVDFNLRRADTFSPISLPSFDIQVPTNGVVDLTSVIPVASSPGVLTTQGPKGDKGDKGDAGVPGPSGSKQQVIDALIGGGWPKVLNGATNPAFEIDLAGWTGVGGTLTRQTASPPAWVTGTAWARLTTGTGATRPGALAATANDQRINLGAGEWAAVSMAMANAAGYTSQIGIRFYDASNVRLSESMSTPASSSGGRVTHSAQAPAGTVYAQPVPYMYNGGTVLPAGVTLDFDDVMLCSGATQAAALAAVATPVNGSMPNAYWLGTAHNSASTGVLTAMSRTALPGTVAPVYYNSGAGLVLVAGETGQRNLTTTNMLNGWTGTGSALMLSRSANTVMLVLSNVNGSAMTNTLLCTLPSGFRPSAYAPGLWCRTNAATKSGVLGVDVNGNVTLQNSVAGDTGVNGVVTFHTSDAWPSTLPGV